MDFKSRYVCNWTTILAQTQGASGFPGCNFGKTEFFLAKRKLVEKAWEQIGITEKREKDKKEKSGNEAGE